ncbi:MAG: 3-hydroxyacyl-CoA dehydrogenase/enoyl-CoA hydratase family protein [Thaumarchaeota archaeon]|nr:3-hydroxyacyl-CoA dehydrogenase/enoyl-CoA hydratase family protein [Nitrososphaerota archaeon]
MRIEEVSKVAVLGAGTMGHGIAEVAALAGYQVSLYDVEQKFLDSGLQKIRWSLSKLEEKGNLPHQRAEETFARVKPTLSLDQAVSDADVVIEAVPEDPELKKKIFSQIDKINRRALLASNTSTIPISEISSASRRKENFVGLHFFNPPVLMPLVEVVRGGETDDATVSLAKDLVKKFGKQSVICNKDVPGFIVNRILGPLMNEAAWMVARNKTTVEAVDSCAIFRAGLPMGVFELADYSGIDTIYRASEAMRQRGASSIPVAPQFKKLTEQGKLGNKSGEGFYKHIGEGGRPAIARGKGESLDPLTIFAPAINSCAWLIRNGVSTKEEIDIAVKLGLGFPDGILQMADRWGLDKLVSTLREKEKEYGNAYAPDPLLVEMAERGKTGVAAGAGFYDYTSAEKRYEEMTLRKSPPVAWVVLNRPHRLNAITPKMIDELEMCLKEVDRDGSIRVVGIRGEGDKAFSAGADISSYEFSSPSKVFDASRRWFEVFTLVERLSKPVVAAINGYAFGGGCELVLACDFRLASKSSQIGLTETNLGLMPGAGGTQKLVRVVGLSNAKRMIFFGERVPAEEALRIGLVDAVFSNEEFDSKVDEFVAKLAKRAPIALKFAKRALNLSFQVPTDLGQLFEASAFSLLVTTQDVSEGISAFLSKREPEFKGE